MRRHLITIVLLIIATVAFVTRYIVVEQFQTYCDIAAFVLPTIAALVEIVLAEKNGKATEEKIQDIKDNQLWIDVDEENEGLIINKGVN